MQILQNTLKSRNYRIAAVIAVATLLWLSSGLLRGNDSRDAAPQMAPSRPLASVQARHIYASPYLMHVRVRGRTEPNREVDLRAELSGRVASVPVARGSQVSAGDVICKLAVEDRQLRFTESQSTLDKVQMEYDGALRLKSGGYQSRTAIAAAKARLESARAELKRRQLDLANINIRAPFDGIVDARPVEVGDYMERGDICATVLDLDPLVISGQVAEAEVGRIPAGGQVSVTLLTGETVSGKIRFIQRSSDNITRTFRIEAVVANPALALRSGITAQLQIATANIAAHVVPASLLALDDEGRVGVRILDRRHRVDFVPVELIGDHPEGVWVTGLPEQSLLITVGQEYVTTGEEITVTLENQIEMSAAGL